ncbi:MAG TPA: Clp protease N-terminal domain-containing protein [Solirubrobacteraceae bacterium]|nr:Clp protease N-terminal domain-containing protein [Solirubrobacteraceae bacterium]
MFDGFSENAKQVVARAQECARDLNHRYVGSEHLLLALLADDMEIPAQVLSSFRIDRDKVLVQVLETVGTGEEPQSGNLPFTPSAKYALEMGLGESLALGQRHIGTGHMLLGLLRDYDGPAVRILLDLKVPLAKLRAGVLQQLGGPGTEERSDPSGGLLPEPPRVASGAASGGSSNVGGFAALPDPQLRQLLRAAGARAAAEARREFGFADLLAAANQVPDMRKLLDASS